MDIDHYNLKFELPDGTQALVTLWITEPQEAHKNATIAFRDDPNETWGKPNEALGIQVIRRIV